MNFPALIFTLGLMGSINASYILWSPFYRGIREDELRLEKPNGPKVPGMNGHNPNVPKSLLGKRIPVTKKKVFHGVL